MVTVVDNLHRLHSVSIPYYNVAIFTGGYQIWHIRMVHQLQNGISVLIQGIHALSLLSIPYFYGFIITRGGDIGLLSPTKGDPVDPTNMPLERNIRIGFGDVPNFDGGVCGGRSEVGRFLWVKLDHHDEVLVLHEGLLERELTLLVDAPHFD